MWVALNMAHIRQSRPDSDLGFQVNVLEELLLFPLPSKAAPEAAHIQFLAFSNFHSGTDIYVPASHSSPLFPFGSRIGRRRGNWEWRRSRNHSSTCVGSLCRADMAHIREARPDSGLDFLAKVLFFFKLFSLGSRIGRLRGNWEWG